MLDTNIVSALMRGDEQVLRRLRRLRSGDVAIPQPVLAEIAYGVHRLPESKRKAELLARFELIRVELARAEWTDAVSDAFGQIKASLEKSGQPIEDFDAAIAAHALASGATLVSGNGKHMKQIKKLAVEDWQEADWRRRPGDPPRAINRPAAAETSAAPRGARRRAR